MNALVCGAGGFIGGHLDLIHNNAVINSNMAHAASTARAVRYACSSSVCIHRDMEGDSVTVSLPLQAAPAGPVADRVART